MYEEGVAIFVMTPSFMRQKESEPELDETITDELMAQVDSEEPAKPWTIVSRASDNLEEADSDDIREALRRLTLHGKITPTADGNLEKDPSES